MLANWSYTLFDEKWLCNYQAAKKRAGPLKPGSIGTLGKPVNLSGSQIRHAHNDGNTIAIMGVTPLSSQRMECNRGAGGKLLNVGNPLPRNAT
jgi:hypothetical protein